MPELPEVQTVVSTLRPRLIGRTVHRVRLERKDILTPPNIDLVGELEGRRITGIDRRGKRIVFTLDNGSRFYIHLGMSGRLTVVGGDPKSEPNARDVPLAKHTHLVITFDSSAQLRFFDPRRFGGIWWLGSSTPQDDDETMGPEPLTLRTKELAQRLGRTRRPIKSALLDQRLIAGLGNIYVDEALHAAGIHPLALTHKLRPEQVSLLNRSIKTVLRRAIRHRGSTLRDYVDADGESGGFQKLHRVYGRKGEPCHRCRTEIQRIVLGGRSTHFCPQCQPRKR